MSTLRRSLSKTARRRSEFPVLESDGAVRRGCQSIEPTRPFFPFFLSSSPNPTASQLAHLAATLKTAAARLPSRLPVLDLGVSRARGLDRAIPKP
ncbi:hypothetical protein PR202_gb07092 [Eleusine coracana subsp. coracana]|uniref:Uncharacterized protein n=1 Tax=Eleusine coracana subsp. coracana TaxID=191504 RepID=A0AAV5E8U6_ELECO|nr:hypothetical protein PR202_gb07092 [Eleusine coracana subsp. coracana]